MGNTTENCSVPLRVVHKAAAAFAVGFEALLSFHSEIRPSNARLSNLYDVQICGCKSQPCCKPKHVGKIVFQPFRETGKNNSLYSRQNVD